MSRRKRSRPDIEKLRHEVRLLRGELSATTKKIDKAAEIKFNLIDARATKLLDGFAKKMSTLMMLAEAKIKQEGLFKRIWNKIAGGQKSNESK